MTNLEQTSYLMGEKLKPFSLNSGMKQGCSLPLLLFNSLGIPSHSNRQEEEIKGIKIGKEVVKQCLFTDGMILYLKNPNNFTPKL
jgi:hypothetical protein